LGGGEADAGRAASNENVFIFHERESIDLSYRLDELMDSDGHP
jgi:hypothetical protein